MTSYQKQKQHPHCRASAIPDSPVIAEYSLPQCFAQVSKAWNVAVWCNMLKEMTRANFQIVVFTLTRSELK